MLIYNVKQWENVRILSVERTLLIHINAFNVSAYHRP